MSYYFTERAAIVADTNADMAKLLETMLRNVASSQNGAEVIEPYEIDRAEGNAKALFKLLERVSAKADLQCLFTGCSDSSGYPFRHGEFSYCAEKGRPTLKITMICVVGDDAKRFCKGLDRSKYGYCITYEGEEDNGEHETDSSRAKLKEWPTALLEDIARYHLLRRNGKAIKAEEERHAHELIELRDLLGYDGCGSSIDYSQPGKKINWVNPKEDDYKCIDELIIRGMTRFPFCVRFSRMFSESGEDQEIGPLSLGDPVIVSSDWRHPRAGEHAYIHARTPEGIDLGKMMPITGRTEWMFGFPYWYPYFDCGYYERAIIACLLPHLRPTVWKCSSARRDCRRRKEPLLIVRFDLEPVDVNEVIEEAHTLLAKKPKDRSLVSKDAEAITATALCGEGCGAGIVCPDGLPLQFEFDIEGGQILPGDELARVLPENILGVDLQHDVELRRATIAIVGEPAASVKVGDEYRSNVEEIAYREDAWDAHERTRMLLTIECAPPFSCGTPIDSGVFSDAVGESRSDLRRFTGATVKAKSQFEDCVVAWLDLDYTAKLREETVNRILHG